MSVDRRRAEPGDRDRTRPQIKTARSTSRAGDYMHCSIGVGPNAMLAKMAADMKKPNGLTRARRRGPAGGAARAETARTSRASARGWSGG